MLFHDPLTLAVIVVAVILVGLAKGGFAGFGALATPLLATVLPPTQAAALLLPILVVVELLAQVAVGAVIDPLTVADIHPEIVLDGAGYLPSGSIARLCALTLGGAYLLRPTAPRAAGGLVSVGSVLLLVEAVTRLYLARHLGLDLLGGLLLGLALFLALTLLVPHPDTRGTRRSADGPRNRRGVGPQVS